MTDAESDPIVSYDVGTSGGYLVLDGTTQASGSMLTYTATQFAQLTYQAGTATDTNRRSNASA